MNTLNVNMVIKVKASKILKELKMFFQNGFREQEDNLVNTLIKT